ncbi:ATP-dependent DNA helicase [Amycolatopsis sp. H20-H5]|uniref:ATP-dependent DNA helicase n=1 Tax=Amycolatopsis sp. H20-H5 TaxID=3046309 RepID=UPI002DBE4985|nr:AAA family ATPase [Amycolatopsis sp. H20-H5]MEC3981025.1 AAA family ATPase [Amycolatopsis sp. H20-H5]
MLRVALHQLRRKRKVILEHAPEHGPDPVAFPARLHRAETTLANDLWRLLHAPSRLATRPAAARFIVDPPVSGDGRELDSRQRDAVRMALSERVSILTGGPGCGKSFTLRTIAETVVRCGGKVTLSAPTGRAAKRLVELTGLPATTIHRPVRPKPGTDAVVTLFDDTDPLQADLVVVDEASMLDVRLADELVAKIPEGAHLLLVGDIDQQPSIGSGCVLRDLLAVPDIAHVRLERVYRQGPGSSISTGADAVRRGQMPTIGGEFWLVPVTDPANIPGIVVDVATRRLPAAYGLDPRDVQVLCPGRARDTGALNVGRLIQDQLNPHTAGEAQHWSDDRAFRPGDKVMPARNNYDKGTAGVFNGSAGTVTSVDVDDRTVTVTLDDGEAVIYGFDELDELAHAYAITVHRSQGSEYAYVVIALSSAAGPFLLQRNLLYTAITRAKTMVVIVGSHDALRRAIRNSAEPRNTRLTTRFSDPADHEPTPEPPTDTDAQLSAF